MLQRLRAGIGTFLRTDRPKKKRHTNGDGVREMAVVEVTDTDAVSVKRNTGYEHLWCMVFDPISKKIAGFVKPGGFASCPAFHTMLIGTEAELLAEIKTRKLLDPYLKSPTNDPSTTDPGGGK